MRPPKLSIRAVMLVVLVMAADLAALRVLFEPFSLDNVLFGLTTIPTGGLIIIAFGCALGQLRKGHGVDPLLVGMLAGGSLGFVVMAILVSDTRRAIEFYERTMMPMQSFLGVRSVSHPSLG